MARTSSPARSRNGASPSAKPRSVTHRPSDEPDVFLDVPDLHVDEIHLDVENLEAHLALEARLANLVELRAGAHVAIEKVQVDIEGVAAQATLKVRLENVYAILDRALTTLDHNPQLLQGVIDTVDDALGSDGLLGDAIDGVSRSVRPGSGGKLAHLGRRVRNLGRTGHRVPLATKVATAAGMIGGVALTAHNNGGIGKTFKELTS
jgi:hypothetical protein